MRGVSKKKGTNSMRDKHFMDFSWVSQIFSEPFIVLSTPNNLN